MMLHRCFFGAALFFYLLTVGVACSSQQSKPVQNQSNNAESTEGEDTAAKASVVLSEAAKEGKTIFKINCAQCHLMSKEDLIGPGMKGVTEKYDQEWLIAFIKNSQAMIAAGDEKAIAVYEKYYKTVMPSFSFNEEEVNQLLAYLKEGGE